MLLVTDPDTHKDAKRVEIVPKTILDRESHFRRSTTLLNMTLTEITRDEDAQENRQYLVQLRKPSTKTTRWVTGHFFRGTLFLNVPQETGEKRLAFYELPE